MRNTRRIQWLKAARKDFQAFPPAVVDRAADALTVIAEGGTPLIAKPLVGLGAGVWELAIKVRGDAFRVVYAVQVGDDIWVVHAFQKKSKAGVATPRHEVETVRARLRRLREILG